MVADNISVVYQVSAGYEAVEQLFFLYGGRVYIFRKFHNSSNVGQNNQEWFLVWRQNYVNMFQKLNIPFVINSQWSFPLQVLIHKHHNIPKGIFFDRKLHAGIDTIPIWRPEWKYAL